ncbi:MAG: hypothetical protein E7556_02025 [Ruminococcaceae bacterium]|nr:hypothetical protein [Oscillospiraceae bacterium]
MNWKKIFRVLLFPHIAVMFILIPVAVAFLIYSMLKLESDSVVAIISYVVSAYTLTIWCFKIPDSIRFFRNFNNENKYLLRWNSDTRLRVNVSLYKSLILNTVYAIFMLWLGFYHKTFWFLTLSGYYFSLVLMRFFLVRYTRKYQPGEKMIIELKKYRACGVVFLLVNLSLAVMVFFKVYWNRTFNHHEITTIAMALYTFTSLVIAIRGIVKFRKYESPVYSASKAINLAAACVSMLTLESTMLTTFGDGTMDLLTRQILLGVTGGVISIFIVAMAIYMIVSGGKKIKELKNDK